MKIYKKIVIDISSGNILEEVSYDYIGEIAYCSSGGSSGGGSTSGRVDYPEYMKTAHGGWITDAITLVTAAQTGNSPYYASVPYDPATPLAAIDTAITAFNSLVDALSHESDWVSAVAQAKTTIDALIDDTYINADIVEFAAVLDDQIDNTVMPKFQRGMQDINAVQTSAFVLGEALIYGMRDRDIAKYGSELRMKLNVQRNDMIINSASIMLSNMIQRVDFERVIMHYIVESKRMFIVAKNDENNQDIQLDELDAKWDLECFAYGANVLASIGGGVASTSAPKGKSQAASALGGALSGAAAGAAATSGNSYGTAAGAAIGYISAYL